MQRVDLVIIALAVVAVVGSAVGVVWYDAEGVNRFDVEVTEQEDSEPQWSTTLTGPDGRDSNTWPLETQNITQVTFTISISSTLTPRTDDTIVTFTISHPDGNVTERDLTIPSNADSGSDEDTVEITIQDVPSGERRVLAQDADAALMGDDGQPVVPASTNGTGEWRVDAEVTDGGATFVAGQNLGDEEVQVEVDVEYRYYTASAEPHVPDISPAG